MTHQEFKDLIASDLRAEGFKCDAVLVTRLGIYSWEPCTLGETGVLYQFTDQFNGGGYFLKYKEFKAALPGIVKQLKTEEMTKALTENP